MASLNYTDGALTDLDDIRHYTLNKWGEQQADHYIHDLDNACHDIAEGKIPTQPFPELKSISGYYHCEHHYIFFSILSGETTVLAVLHERMDVLNRLKERL